MPLKNFLKKKLVNLSKYEVIKYKHIQVEFRKLKFKKNIVYDFYINFRIFQAMLHGIRLLK